MNGYTFILTFLISVGAEEICRQLLLELSEIGDINHIIHHSLGITALVPDCKPAVALKETSSAIVEFHKNANSISKQVLEAKLHATVDMFSELNFFGKESHALARILRVLGGITRPVLSKTTPSGCRNAHRYKASTMANLESNSERFSDKYILFPIASRMRDIGISRNRCPEDTLVSKLSIARSIVQLAGLEQTYPLLRKIESELKQFGLVHLLSVSQPVLHILESLLIVVHNPIDQTAFLYSENLHTSHPVRNLKKFENEAAAVVSKLNSAVGSWRIDKDLRREFLFFQSVNTDWFERFREGWGLNLTAALVGLRNRLDRTCPSSDCEDSLFENFSQNYLNNSIQIPVGETIGFGIDLLARADPRCTLLISAAFTLVQDGLVRAVTQKKNSNENITKTILNVDAGMLMEMAWQTIAGERLSELLTNKHVPIFELMHLTWLHA
jgi:hypothetical protein